MTALTWAGLPVALRLVQPRYQVIVDALGIGEVWELGERLWGWRHYEVGATGSAPSRRAAAQRVIAEHDKTVAFFAKPDPSR